MTITVKGANQAVASNPHAGQEAIGKVVILQGQAQATAVDGAVRTLSPNSVVFANDHIVTGSDGSLSLFIAGNPPTQLDIGRMANITLDEDVYAPVSVTPPTDVMAEVASLQEVLFRGESPTEMEATAAGVGAGGVGGAHPTISFDLTANDVIYGGAGNDTIYGGSGADTFVISENSNNLIKDYSLVNGDVLDISDVIRPGDSLVIEADADGKLRLSIREDDGAGAEKASVTFGNINYADSGFNGDMANDIELLKSLIEINN